MEAKTYIFKPVELLQQSSLLKKLQGLATLKRAPKGRITLTTELEGYKYYIHTDGIITDNFSGITCKPKLMGLTVNKDCIEIDFDII